jgi:hypothetical protein
MSDETGKPEPLTACDLPDDPAATINRIGAMTFQETEQFMAPQLLRRTETGRRAPQSLVAVTFLPDTVSLAASLVRLQFPLRIPSWAPPDLARHDVVQLVDERSLVEGGPRPDGLPVPLSVHLRWTGARGGVHYSVYCHPGERRGPRLVIPGSITELRVGTTPAVLQRGLCGFSPDTGEVRQIDALLLRWEEGELAYQLRTHGGAVSAEELLQMAESLAPPAAEEASA